MKEKMSKTLNELIGSGLGLYDSRSSEGGSVVAYKVIDVTDICPNETQVVIKYANVTRGRIAQICTWYERGKDLGMCVHYHINEMTPETLASDEVFNRHATMFGVRPIKLSKVIFKNQ